MKSGFGVFTKLRRVLLPDLPSLLYFPRNSVFEICSTTTCLTNCQAKVEIVEEENKGHSKGSREVLRSWGCSEDDISKIFIRSPSIRNADLAQLQSKLNLLSGLGISAFELVRIISCRPTFLCRGINRCFDEQLQYLRTLFESNEFLVKAIVRNPSLLTYDFQNKIKPAIELYQEMGLSKKDLTAMLLLWPTLIPRTSFEDEKMEYKRKTGLSRNSKM